MSVAALPSGLLGFRSRLRPLPLSSVGCCATCNNRLPRRWNAPDRRANFKVDSKQKSNEKNSERDGKDGAIWNAKQF